MVWFFVAVAAIIAGLGGLYWRWARRVDAEIAEGAAVEWTYLLDHESDLVEGLDRAQFDAIFRRVHFPRFPGYALACLVAFAAALPVIFGLLAGGLFFAEAVGWTPEPAEIADRYLVEGDRMRIIRSASPEAALYYVEDLGGFYYFFGVLAAWLGIVAFFMHRYHSRRPGYLRDEIIRARE